MKRVTAFAAIVLLSCSSGIAIAAGGPAHSALRFNAPTFTPPPPRPTSTAPTFTATTVAQPTTTGPTFTGQPNQSCGSATAPFTPGMSASAPGSAFNPDGKAGTVYAGQQPQNSNNTASVSQYDVACFHQR